MFPKEPDQRQITIEKESRIFSYIYGKLPFNATSRMMGRIAGVNMPGWMRSPVHRVYGWMFSVNLNEIEHCGDLRQYHSLSDFFTRNLLSISRPIHPTDVLVSPCDGRVLAFGEILDGHLEEVKGLRYTLSGLLGPNTWSLLQNWMKECNFDSQTRSQYISGYNGSKENEDGGSIGSSDYTNSNEDLDRSSETGNRYLKRSISFLQHNSSSGIFQMCENIEVDEEETVADVNEKFLYDKHLMIQNHVYYNPRSRIDAQGGEKTLFHCVIYLGPGDYHKFHSPTNWNIHMRRHFPGKLFSVSPKVANWHSGVFCANERASYVGRWEHGFFAFVAVGALNVGSIKVPLDPELKTNIKVQSKYRKVPFRGLWKSLNNNKNDKVPVITQSQDYHDFIFPHPTPLSYGQLFGEFNFGSSIVLIFEAPKSFQFHSIVGEKVKVGQGIGSIFKHSTITEKNYENDIS